MDSNLPPGVTDSMIPGNTPADVAWEQLLDMAKVSPVQAPADTEGMRLFVVLADRETYTELEGCTVIAVPSEVTDDQVDPYLACVMEQL